MFKKTDNLETDAAPSRPRTDEEMADRSAEEEQLDDDDDDDIDDAKPDNDEIPEFKTETTKKRGRGNTFITTSNILVSNATGVHIGNQYNFHGTPGVFMKSKMPNKEDLMKNTKPSTAPPEVEKCFMSREPVEQKHFVCVKTCISPNLRRVAKQLGISDAEVQKLQQQCKSRPEYAHEEVFYQMMLKWQKSTRKELATVGMLCKVLWNADEHEAARTLAKLYS